MKKFSIITFAALTFLPSNAHALGNAYQCKTNSYLTHVRTDTPWRAHVVTYVHLTDTKKFPAGGATINKIRCRLHPSRTLADKNKPATQVIRGGENRSE